MTIKEKIDNRILQKEKVDKGKIIIGDTIVFGYYSQELIKVSDQKRVIEVIKDIAEYIPLEKGKELSLVLYILVSFVRVNTSLGPLT